MAQVLFFNVFSEKDPPLINTYLLSSVDYRANQLWETLPFDLKKMALY